MAQPVGRTNAPAQCVAGSANARGAGDDGALAARHRTRSQAIAGRFANEQAELEASRSALVKERQERTARLEAAESDRSRAQAGKELAEHACAKLDAQLRDSHALRAELAQQRDRLQVQCDQLSAELQELRGRLVEQQQTAAAERARQEAYVRNLEDRAHQEVDRLREENKHWQQRHEATERSHRNAEAAFQTELGALRDQLRSSEKEVACYAGQVAGLEKAVAKRTTTRPKKAAAPSRKKRQP